MKHEITLLEDDNYDLEDDPLDRDTDFSKVNIDVERTKRLREMARARMVRLDADLLEFFQTPEAVNEALREVMEERLRAA